MGTMGFSVGMVDVSLESVVFTVGATGFSVVTMGFSVETGVSEWPVGGTGDLEGSTVGTGPAKKKIPGV